MTHRPPPWRHLPDPREQSCLADVHPWPCDAERMRLRAEELDRQLVNAGIALVEARRQAAQPAPLDGLRAAARAVLIELDIIAAHRARTGVGYLTVHSHTLAALRAALAAPLDGLCVECGMRADTHHLFTPRAALREGETA